MEVCADESDEKRQGKPVTMQMKLKLFGLFARTLCAQDCSGFDKDPMLGLLLSAKVVTDTYPKRPVLMGELATMLKALGPASHQVARSISSSIGSTWPLHDRSSTV